MAYKPRYGTKRRDYLYSRELNFSRLNGLGNFPICPHCDQPVKPDQAWDEAHITVPRCFGGKSTGVGHRECNQRDNHQTVTPAASKARNVWKKHVGITGPGLGPAPMQAGRRSTISKTMRNGVQPRRTLAERHRSFMRARYPFLQPEGQR